MKKTLLLSFFCSIMLSGFSQDSLFTINNYGDYGITYYSSVNPNTGKIGGATGTFGTTEFSAAMAINPSGYIYYIPTGMGNANGLGKGSFEVKSIKANGTQATPSTALTSTDINGAANNNEVEFKRLAVRKDGWAYMIVTEPSTGIIYMARFMTHNDGKADQFQSLGTITLNDVSSINTFNNGDLAFDGNGNVCVLVNSDATNSTKIYTASATTINSATSSSVITLTSKWTLKTPSGANFTTPVTGLAFSSAGNMYVTALGGGSGGIYFIDQNTINNFGTGTVNIIGPVVSGNNLADIATTCFPTNTKLSIEFGAIRAKVCQGNLKVSWSTDNELNNDHFDIEVSKDGKTFKKVGTVSSKAANGNSSQTLNYEFVTPLGSFLSMLGISVFSLAFMLLFFNKKNKLLMMFTLIISFGLTTTSCSKRGQHIDTLNGESLSVRIVQVGMNGETNTSKIVVACNAE